MCLFPPIYLKNNKEVLEWIKMVLETALMFCNYAPSMAHQHCNQIRFIHWPLSFTWFPSSSYMSKQSPDTFTMQTTESLSLWHTKTFLQVIRELTVYTLIMHFIDSIDWSSYWELSDQYFPPVTLKSNRTGESNINEW